MKRFILGFVILWCVCLSAIAQATSFTDLKFGQYQIADSQWDVGACLYTNTCNIYSTQPGTMYQIPWWNGQWNWQSGQYVKFLLSGISGYPYTANVYNSDGSLAGSIGSGKIINMGVDANGYALFFFVGTDDNTGQLFSTNYGFTGTGGYSWTGTLNPTISQVDSFSVSYGSTTPLSPGQTFTATSSTPSGPTVSGGTITQSNAPNNQIIGSGSGIGISNNQQSRVNTWNNGSNQNANNYLYIDQVSGSYNDVTITQTTSTGKNKIEATIGGTGNNVINATQSGTNYLKLDVTGNNNNVTSQQSNNSLTSNYKETTVNGNSNIISTNQKDNSNHIMFTTVTGNSNSVTAVQEGTGGHYLENKLTGNNNSVLANQSGNTKNNATIDLTNNGGAASVDLQQSGGKSFSIIQSCTNPAGCSTVVRQ
jgi:hypothetical protein